MAPRPARGRLRQNSQGPPGAHAKGLAGVLGTPPGVLAITGQVVKRIYIFNIYVCKLGNKISVYFSLTLISIFLIEKNHRKRCLWNMEKLAYKAALNGKAPFPRDGLR